MKRVATYLAGFFLLAIITTSCSKQGHDDRQEPVQSPQVIQASVSGAQTYVLNLGTGNTASIQKQAAHSAVSEIRTASDGSTAYNYTPLKGFTGGDEVTLLQTSTYIAQSGGCYPNSSAGRSTTTSKAIVIKFTVAN